MNWKKEADDKLTLTRAQFAALQAEIVAELEKVDTGTDALRVMRENFRIDGDLTFNPCFNGHVWEHPTLTAYNKRQGSKGILNAGFFTLYAMISDYQKSTHGSGQNAFTIPAYSEGYIQFLLGRVGNTFSVGRTFKIQEETKDNAS